MNAYERLLLPENLNYAWIKAKNLYRTADGYIDACEIAEFELDLEQRLQDIRGQFKSGSYRLKKLRPLPRPKKISDDRAIDRQYYHVAIEDQVAWIALVNALGPELDQQMEAWNYGNRLYRPAWYEPDEASHSRLEIGPYRHATGHLYRKFQHSWPLFRRHITLTARTMVVGRRLLPDELDEPDRLAATSAERAKLIYCTPNFWRGQGSEGAKGDLYHASIDLKQFYPALKIDAVLKGLKAGGGLADPRLARILKSMLNFQIDMSDMPETAMENVDPPFLRSKVNGIPTGLFVAGFLANAAMFPIDRLVAKRLEAQRDVAHFRFVDDHTLIAYDFDTLCEWILWYEQILADFDIGPSINSEKYDPASLGSWLEHRKSVKSAVGDREKYAELRANAKRDTRLDGKNPTKLMTKTLTQVSAIAAIDINILDDEDLGERLRMLEWLLLADIPEREIRPDTRAAFAAGQIASLVPLLIQETDGLVDAARDLAAYKLRQPKSDRSQETELQRYREELLELETSLNALIARHEKSERTLLDRSFKLLLLSLREYPGKARLFYRVHQFCRVTGHRGLATIGEWLAETRAAGHESWADYYVALSFQVMAGGLYTTARLLRSLDALQSEVKAAQNHLQDIANLDLRVFWVRRERETWYHAGSRREFAVALLQVAEVLRRLPGHDELAHRLMRLAQEFASISSKAPAKVWLSETGHTTGVWAHLAENLLSVDMHPSAAWSALSPYFAVDQRNDLLAVRRYPEHLSDAAWVQVLNPSITLPETDSGWLFEAIGSNKSRIEQAQVIGKSAFKRAARALTELPDAWITVHEWTKKVLSCNVFDPRRGEWTALEIIEQLLVTATATGQSESVLDRLNPNNVLLPSRWVACSPCLREQTQLSWEEWKEVVRRHGKTVQVRKSETSLLDYRYAPATKLGSPIPSSERRLAAVGRLLLGLLRNNHSAPRIWNLRGNELTVPLPRGRWLEALAISSRTTQLLEACLGVRSAETRAITRTPSLFGLHDGEKVNDTEFEGPEIYGSTDLLEEIRQAKKILEDNQLAVARNQPRQLIPFRILDFATSSDPVDTIGERGDDA